MLNKFALGAVVLILPVVATAQQPSAPSVALTIYNDDFAVARSSIDLDLHPGVNEVTTTDVTSRLEPDSVVLRDPAGKYPIRILEQNYDAAIVDENWLMKKFEGKTIDFEIATPEGMRKAQGKIIRAPYMRPAGYDSDGQYQGSVYVQPLIEMEGKIMRFQVPGTALFPATTEGLQLKPTLRWQIDSQKQEHFSAELAYITGGLDWNATYNIVVPDPGNAATEEKADVLGWVTIHNQSGTDFPQARIKLMAGDVAKIRSQDLRRELRGAYSTVTVSADAAGQVTQKPFDDFHLYDLNRTVALPNGEVKQVQFLEAPGVKIQRRYVYDGAATQLQPVYNGFNFQNNYGLDDGNTKVAILEEIHNSESNHLGMPLPAGRVRLYRRDADGQMEFVGENMIGHTPAEDTLKLLTGNAFDLKGQRRQTDFHIDQTKHIADESFEIKLSNQKQQPVEIAVVERLYRGENWEITNQSSGFSKRDSHAVEFPVQVPAKGTATLTYTVHYSW